MGIRGEKMPCCDDRSGYDYTSIPLSEYNSLKERLDRVTQLLCYTLGTMMDYEGHGLFEEPALVEWWQEHLAADETRLAPKMVRHAQNNPRDNAEKVARHFLKQAQAVHPVSEYHIGWFMDLAEEACEERDAEYREALRQEKLKTSAINKLNDEERKVLGL
jgi:hypothetical protein